MPTLALNREDLVLLRETVDQVLEGYPEAKEQTIEDHSLDDVETLMVVTASLDNEFSRLTAIRDHLWQLENRVA
jgi:hypothetical protein